MSKQTKTKKKYDVNGFAVRNFLVDREWNEELNYIRHFLQVKYQRNDFDLLNWADDYEIACWIVDNLHDEEDDIAGLIEEDPLGTARRFISAYLVDYSFYPAGFASYVMQRMEAMSFDEDGDEDGDEDEE
jgi:hypothetical protein